MKKKLWSTSTTLRNPERAYQFLSTIAEMKGREWTEAAQEELQCRLIKNRYYKPMRLDELDYELVEAFNDPDHELTLEEAQKIFYAQNYEDPPMRGRTSFDPIEKMGLAALLGNKIVITDTGQRFLNGEIEIGDVMLAYLLKFQYPNPLIPNHLRKAFHEYNTKPFVNALRLIKYVNEKCVEQNIPAKGISMLEFGIFALSITNYSAVPSISDELLAFREHYDSLISIREKDLYVTNYIREYLKDFNNPQKNIYEYTDNVVRCLRLTKYIRIHGGGYYVDLEERRMTEINAILDDLSGAADTYSEKEYIDFIGNYNGYTLPFETVESLRKIVVEMANEINGLERALHKGESEIVPLAEVESLKGQISDLREKRFLLQNETLRYTYSSSEKIDEAIYALRNIKVLGIKPSIALEKWTTIALNIIDDAQAIKPNAPVGDDNEPIFTAPSKVPDIECYYDSFCGICEVTMLTGRDQWFNEGQPVMRHLRYFEERNKSLPNYCLFVAPSIHPDTLSTFWNAVKYEYDGAQQKIIPITISDLIRLLEAIKSTKRNNLGRLHKELMHFYDSCTSIGGVSGFSAWREHIVNEINNFEKVLAAA